MICDELSIVVDDPRSKVLRLTRLTCMVVCGYWVCLGLNLGNEQQCMGSVNAPLRLRAVLPEEEQLSFLFC